MHYFDDHPLVRLTTLVSLKLATTRRSSNFCHRKTHHKHIFHYLLLVALLIMFTSTSIFWVGIIITALSNQDEASHALENLGAYVICAPTTAESSNNCTNSPEVSGGPSSFNNSAPAYFTTAALVCAVCIFSAILDRSNAQWEGRWPLETLLSGGAQRHSTHTTNV